MKLADLVFERPAHLAAVAPIEESGRDRDDVRLLVSSAEGHAHRSFRDLPALLRRGDVLVVNESATMPASLPASGSPGEFVLNLSTRFGEDLWLAEPRWAFDRPGPLPLVPGDAIRAGGIDTRIVARYPGLPRLLFVAFDGSPEEAMACAGTPIRYGYVEHARPLDDYQTVFARVPGSAEMPSAARPFTTRLVDELHDRGIVVAPILLHTGVSSLEVEADDVLSTPLVPEPFVVPASTAAAVNSARRVIAVGTTVARALESAHDGMRVRASSGMSRRMIHPGCPVRSFDGLLTGLHDPVTTHLALLYAVGGTDLVRSGYEEAVVEEYRWHEFGDSHLILRPGADHTRRAA